MAKKTKVYTVREAMAPYVFVGGTTRRPVRTDADKLKTLAEVCAQRAHVPSLAAIKCMFCLTGKIFYWIQREYDPGCINLFLQNKIPVFDAGDGETMGYGACKAHGDLLLDLPSEPHQMRPDHVVVLIESARLPEDERRALLAAWNSEKKFADSGEGEGMLFCADCGTAIPHVSSHCPGCGS